MMFCQTLGGAVFISVGNNIFDSRLARDLTRIPGINVGSVVKTGATDLRKMVSSSMLPQVLMAYNVALRATFYLVTALTFLTVVGSAAMEWRSVKKGQQKQVSGAEKGEEK
jgi:hypothetical protein